MKGFCNYCLDSDKELEVHTGYVICNDCWVKELIKYNPLRVKVSYLTHFDETDFNELIETRVGFQEKCEECKKIKDVYENPDNDGSHLCLGCLKDSCGGYNFNPIDKNGKTIYIDLQKLKQKQKPKLEQVAVISESQWVRARDYQ